MSEHGYIHSVSLFVSDCFTGAIGDLGKDELGHGVAKAVDAIEGYLCAKVGRALTADEKRTLVDRVGWEVLDPYGRFYRGPVGGIGVTTMIINTATGEPMAISQSAESRALVQQDYVKQAVAKKKAAKQAEAAAAVSANTEPTEAAT